MPRAFLPAVQARLMLPLVVRTTKNKRVFVPHKALAHLPRVVSARASEVVAFSVRVPDVERRSWLHGKISSREGINQELSEVLVRHVVVLNRQLVFRRAFVGHVVRRVGQIQIDAAFFAQANKIIDAC